MSSRQEEQYLAVLRHWWKRAGCHLAGSPLRETEQEGQAVAKHQQKPGAEHGAAPATLLVTAPGESEGVVTLRLMATGKADFPGEGVPLLLEITLGALRAAVAAVREAITLEGLPGAGPSLSNAPRVPLEDLRL